MYSLKKILKIFKNLVPTKAAYQGSREYLGKTLRYSSSLLINIFSPSPRPTWYHNGREINDDTDAGFKFEAYGKTLVFNVTMDKAGKYDCRFPMHNDIDRTFNVVVEG